MTSFDMLYTAEYMWKSANFVEMLRTSKNPKTDNFCCFSSPSVCTLYCSFKGAGSRNVNKLLSKRQFCSTFDRPYHRDFPLFFSKWRRYSEDGLLYFLEKQTKHSYVMRLQRYWWIFGSNFLVHSPHPPKSVQDTMARVGNNIDYRDNRFVNGYVTLLL